MTAPPRSSVGSTPTCSRRSASERISRCSTPIPKWSRSAAPSRWRVRTHHRVPRRGVRLRGTASARILRSVSPPVRAGQMIAIVGPQRRRQDHDGQPAAAFLRRERGRDSDRRRRHPEGDHASLRKQIGSCTQDTVPFDDLDSRQHRLWLAPGDACRRLSRRRAPPTHDFIAALPAGLRHHDRRARSAAVGRTAPADLRSRGDSEGRADSGARRGDLGARYRVGAVGAVRRWRT